MMRVIGTGEGGRGYRYPDGNGSGPSYPWPGSGFFGAKSSLPDISDSDCRVAERLQEIRTRFARTANPGMEGLIEGQAWDRETDKYLLITDSLQIKKGYTDTRNIKPDTSRETLFQIQ